MGITSLVRDRNRRMLRRANDWVRHHATPHGTPSQQVLDSSGPDAYFWRR